MRQFILTTTLCCLSLSAATAQDALSLARSTVAHISSCKNISHMSEQKWGGLDDFESGSLDRGLCVFQPEPADTVVGTYYCFKPVNYSLLYNGATSSNINWRDSVAVITDLKAKPGEIKHVESLMLYNNSVMHVYNMLTKALAEKPASLSMLPDTVIDDVAFKRLLLLHVENTDSTGDRHYYQHVFTINPANYLPERSVSTSHSSFGTQIIDNRLYDYRLNDPMITEATFSGENIPAYMTNKERPTVSYRYLTAGKAVPAWELPDLNGNKVSMSALKGQIVLLEFSGVHCGPCMMALPKMKSLHEKFLGKVHVISIYSDEPEDKLKAYAKRKEIPYPIVYNGKKQEKEQRIYEQYGNNGIPTFMLIDKKGIIKQTWVGFSDNIEDEITAQIAQLQK